MKSKVSIAVCGIVVLVLTAVLIGAAPAAREPTRWEYGMYVGSPGILEWQGETASVRATTVARFFTEMGFPSDVEVSARSGRVPPVVLNLLGKQGWELVDVTITPDNEIYWFKRPR